MLPEGVSMVILSPVFAQIGQSADVSVAAWTDVVNYGREEEYHIGKRKAVLYGVDEAYITARTSQMLFGSYIH